MHNDHNCKAFTLVELLLAMAVTGIILAAVATLAFALSSADDAADDTSRKQAQLRFATLRIAELLRACRMICGTPSSDLAVWRADDNSDGQININELVFIQKGTQDDHIRLCQFPASDATVVQLSAIDSVSPDDYDVTYVPLIPECANATFSVDVLPPLTQFVSITFDLEHNGIVRQCQINTALRAWAGHLLNGTQDALVSDDDL